MHKIVILMGGQGSGKGTIARLLMQNSEFNYIETGAAFRALPPESDIAKTIAQGNLVSDTQVFEYMQSVFNTDTNILFDGFPRTKTQAEWLVDFAKNSEIKVIYLNIPESVMRQRIQKRFNEGAGRADDADESAIQRRLKKFHNQTMPAINWLAQNTKTKFSEIDATRTPDEIFQEILSKDLA